MTYHTDKNAPSIHIFSLLYLAMASTVMYAAITGGVPMPPEAHGGAVHVIPASVWAGVLIAQSLITMLATCLKWRIVMALAALVGVFSNGYLAMFADHATFGFLVAKGAAVFAGLNCAIMGAAIIDAVRYRLSMFEGRIN